MHRRWLALPASKRLTNGGGRREAERRLTLPTLPGKTSPAAHECVSVDDPILSFWTGCGDGKVVWLTMLAPADAASWMVPDYEPAPPKMRRRQLG